MAVTPFQRARQYVFTNRSAVVLALLAGILTSLLTIGLLLVFGLITDLLVTHGTLPPQDDAAFRAELERPDSPWASQAGTALDGLLPFVWRQQSSWALPAWMGRRVWAPLYRRNAWMHSYSSALAMLLAAGLGLAVARAVVEYLQHATAATAVVDAVQRLRRNLYRQSQRRGSAIEPTSPLVQIFSREANELRDGLYAWLDRAPDVVLVALLLVLALMLNVPMTLITLGLAALGYFVVDNLRGYFADLSRTATRRAAGRLALLQEGMAMIPMIRAYGMESYQSQRFEDQLEQFSASDAARIRVDAALEPILRLLLAIGIGIVLLLAGWNLSRDLMSVAAVILWAASLIGLYWPVRAWFERRRLLEQADRSAAEVFGFLDQPPQMGQVVGAKFLPPMADSLEFHNVSLILPNGRALLRDITFQVRAGQRVAIMGPDEAANRAIAYLMARLMDPTQGAITIDGNNLREVTLESLRSQVALVLQHELVFTDTVAKNIACAEPNAGFPQIIQAAKIAHAHSFITGLINGYETVVGDQGEVLDTSQQFRIALARAILRDPAILVVEEPTERLDDEVKVLLDDTMARIAAGRTLIYLPHRLSTIRGCDQIIILHEGRIESMGNHRELTVKSDLYRHLQYTEFNVFAGA